MMLTGEATEEFPRIDPHTKSMIPGSYGKFSPIFLLRQQQLFSPGTDAAALAAAAFASCSSLYSGRSFTSYSPPASLQNSSYASTLLQHAQQLYSFAVNARGGQMTYQTSVPIVQD